MDKCGLLGFDREGMWYIKINSQVACKTEAKLKAARGRRFL